MERDGMTRVIPGTLSNFLLGTALALGGCGTSLSTTFPNQLVGSDGQRPTVESLEAITNDSDLDEGGKRDAFRALGIEDEKLIDALLGL